MTTHGLLFVLDLNLGAILYNMYVHVLLTSEICLMYIT